jgi:NTE family protein
VAKRKIKIGLALGGGGARGLSHIGVLKVLEREGIHIDIMTGTSMGAIIGATYALDKNLSRLEEIVKKYSKIKEFNLDFSLFRQNQKKQPFFLKKMSDFLKRGYILNLELRKKCLNDGEGLKGFIKELIDNHYFKDTIIPFSVVATDLVSGEKIILNKGRMLEAILASSSIPGMFPPVNMDNKILVDGGIISVVPIEACRIMGADFVIAVNVSQRIKRKYEFKNAVDILFRSDSITSTELRKIQLSAADAIISPRVSHIHWANFSKPQKCIRAGEVAAENEICELKKKLKQAEPSWWKKLFY